MNGRNSENLQRILLTNERPRFLQGDVCANYRSRSKLYNNIYILDLQMMRNISVQKLLEKSKVKSSVHFLRNISKKIKNTTSAMQWQSLVSQK